MISDFVTWRNLTVSENSHILFRQKLVIHVPEWEKSQGVICETKGKLGQTSTLF